MDWSDRILDCVLEVKPFVFDELALERTVGQGLRADGLESALNELGHVARVISLRSPAAARVLYRAIDRRVRALTANEAFTDPTRRAPMFGASAPAGSMKPAALAARRKV